MSFLISVRSQLSNCLAIGPCINNITTFDVGVVWGARFVDLVEVVNVVLVVVAVVIGTVGCVITAFVNVGVVNADSNWLSFPQIPLDSVL